VRKEDNRERDTAPFQCNPNKLDTIAAKPTQIDPTQMHGSTPEGTNQTTRDVTFGAASVLKNVRGYNSSSFNTDRTVCVVLGEEECSDSGVLGGDERTRGREERSALEWCGRRVRGRVKGRVKGRDGGGRESVRERECVWERVSE
jgi:hypothetical protein